MSPESDDNTPHETYWERLPWWVNGSLPIEHAAQLELHVATCESCASESRALRNLQLRIRGEAVLIAPQSGWQSMAERLDREADLLAGKTVRPARGARWLGAAAPSDWRSNGWRLVATAQSVVLGVVGAVMVTGLASTWWQSQAPPTMNSIAPEYVTMTTAGDTAAPEARRELRMVFRRDISLAEVNALLRALPAQIVAGPSEAGVYTVALQPQSNHPTAIQPTAIQPGATQSTSSELVAQQRATDDDSLASTLARLRADARVVFVEPVTGR